MDPYVNDIVLQFLLEQEVIITEEIYSEALRQQESTSLKNSLKRARLDHAINAIEDVSCQMVGRGHLQPGTEKKPRSVAPFDRAKMMLYLSDPGKLSRISYFNENEFRWLLVPFTASMEAENFCPQKVGYDGALFLIIIFMTKALDYQDIECSWGYAKSSVQTLIARGGPIFLRVMKNALGRLFPNAAEQEILISFLPPSLIDKRIVFLVDTSITLSLDSCDPTAKTTHMDGHKGYGGKILALTDIFGGVVEVIPLLNGNLADQSCFHCSKTFRGLDGHILAPNNTMIGDSLFTGHVTSDPSSKEFVKPHSAQVIADEPNDQVKAIMRSFNYALKYTRAPVEQTNGAFKKCKKVLLLTIVISCDF